MTTRNALTTPQLAAFRPGDLSAQRQPVVAVSGRSNVGKSSLLNRILGHDGARVSRTPGRTQAVFFYATAETYLIADLPGYGFAKAPRENRESWGELAETFFERCRPGLTLHLIDPKIPTSDFDVELRDYLAGLRLPSLTIATKVDRLSQAERAHAKRRLEENFGPAFFVSSKTGEGIEALRRLLRERMNHGETTEIGDPGRRR